MKILAIRIKNLASLEGETHIDFGTEPLCSAGIFAITGVTGAGKSTILDALCLALYAQTPRFNKAGETSIAVTDAQGSALSQNDPRSILRDGTAEGWAEVVFAGIDGEHYRSRWSVRRARSKVTGQIQPFTMELEKVDTSQPFGGTKTEILREIERLAGLNFEQFTRSVLLAQGDFTAFLKATRDEKASLLEKLTGTQIYSRLSQLIFEKNKAAVRDVQDLELHLSGVDILQPERVELLREDLHIVSKQIQLMETSGKNLQEEVQWHRDQTELLNSRQVAAVELEKLAEQRKTAEPRYQRLEEVLMVQDVAVQVSRMQKLEETLQRTGEERETTYRQLQACHRLTEKINAEYESAQLEQQMHQEKQQAAAPLLKRAAELDVILAEKEAQFREAQTTEQAAKNKWQSHRETLDAELKAQNALQMARKKALAWRAAQESRRPIAENHAVIEARLKAAENDWNMLGAFRKELVAAQEHAEILLKEKHKLAEAIASKNAEAEQLKDLLTNLADQRRALETRHLQQKLEDEQEKLHGLSIAQNLFERLRSAEKQCETLQKKVDGLRAEQGQCNQTVGRLREETGLKKAVWNGARNMLERARLEQSEAVEQLRNDLTEGEPCIVCGSTHHPYALQTTGSRVLHSLEEEVHNREQEYLQAVEELSRAEARRQEVESSLPNVMEELLAATVDVEQVTGQWKALPLFEKLSALQPSQVNEFLELESAEGKLKIAGLRKDLNLLTELRAKEEMAREKAQAAEQKLGEWSNQLRDTEREEKTNSENRVRAQKSIDYQQAQLEAMRKSLTAHFVNASWFENWQNEPGAFLETIQNFAGEWKANEESMVELQHEESVLEVKIEGIRGVISAAEKENREAAQATESLRETLQALKTSRQTLWEGRPAQEVENEMKGAVERAAGKVNDCRDRLATAKQEAAIAQKRAEDLAGHLQDLSLQQQDAMSEIKGWINKHMPQKSYEAVLELLQHSAEWRRREQEALHELTRKHHQAMTILQERQKALDSHQLKRKTTREEEELLQAQRELLLEMEGLTGKKNEILFALNKQEENEQKAGELMKQIAEKQSVANDWGALNELIGSADGKKFRQIAQEYTLDILLEYANIELEGLTRRYTMQRIPGTLGLQVIDHDMGDEVRTVFSLSGGESFLLSLALALGLAALSGAQMKVESLFIDEGFGALDPQTLNIAMDALERLHDQGRKVGVISHVQEMTERIPVQIKVRKVAAGRSVAEVVGI